MFTHKYGSDPGHSLGQDYETFISLPEGGTFTSGPGDIVPTSVYSYPSIEAGTSWWETGVKALAPLATAGASIIRAFKGAPEPVPPGYIRNARGQLIPFGSQTANWILPALLIGGGALWFLTRKK